MVSGHKTERAKKPTRRGRLFVLFLRQVKASFGRYFSIVVITMLGISFFAGLRSIGADMRLTAQTYFSDTRFMDIRILSTGGFTEDDLDTVRNVKGVSKVLPAYSGEALVLFKNETYAVRLHSLAPNGKETMNVPTLLEGRMPQKSGECLMDPHFMVKTDIHVGDTVQFTAGDGEELMDIIHTDSFTVVGIAQSPLYISFDRGASTVGSGATDAYCFIPFSDFAYSVYTELNLAVEKDISLDRYSAAYEELLSPIEDTLETTGIGRSKIRYSEIVSDGEKEIADAKKEIADAERDLADAKQELLDARVELNDGWAEYREGKTSFENEIADAKAKLRKGRRQYEEGLKEYEAGLLEYESSKQDVALQLNDAERQLRQGTAQYQSGLASYEQAAQYQNALSVALGSSETADTPALIGALAPAAEAIDPQLASALHAYSGGYISYDQVSQAVNSFQVSLAQNKQQLDAAKQELDRGTAQLNAARQEANAQLSEVKQKLDEAKQELDEAKETLAKNERKLKKAEREGQTELDDAKEELFDGEKEYADGNAEYVEKSAEATVELRDAREEISDGEQALRDLKIPEWYVLDQDENLGFNSFEQDTERMDALSQVVPAVFFLVVALVVMTSMTRLVDSDRSQIGTLKSLGYSKAAIAMTYLLYAATASILGCALGALFGPVLFPRIVFDAYTIMYTLPELKIQYDFTLMVLSVVVAVLSAVLPAYLVCLKSLRSVPAELIRPQSPKPGKRILLERIPFLWKRVSFSEKVSLRNLFRYKKRLLMTVFGVAACTALMFTGFGLNDAIKLIIPKQFEELQLYDMKLTLNKDLSDANFRRLYKALQLEPNIALSAPIAQKNMDVTENGAIMTAVLTSPLSQEAFNEVLCLRERESKTPLTVGDDGVIITEKLADILSVGMGDSFTAVDGDGKRFTFTVSGIAENYLAHYIYISPGLYERVFHEPAKENALLLRLLNTEGVTELSERLLTLDGVSAVTSSTLARSNMQKVMNAMNTIIWVLIISAAALVFVVLFSLNTINLEERSRELATLKVLGFFNKELAAYLYRENVWLTLLGIGAGLLMGVGLERYVLITTEVNMMMFSRDILPNTYLYSAVLTLLFAMLVNLFMLGHFKKIDMVSSLKSVE
ncbi:MAG TPA: FtsX-like permease family protein [Clostridia bacterium]|nr:FtsX-like permease family protein [Clostridia bacterium]